MNSGSIPTHLLGANEAGIEHAAHLLREGGLVAFPTETVYGLGADATNGTAIARVYAAKGRPLFNPLIAHVADLAGAEALGAFNPLGRLLAEAFWPGPLTLVLPRQREAHLSDLVTAGLSTVAVRVPDHAVARRLIASTGRPLAAPSANLSGHVSPTSAEDVLADLAGRIDAVIDAGPCPIGVESTVIRPLDDKIYILRPGGLTRESLAAIVPHVPIFSAANDEEQPHSPGMLASHYAPAAPLRLNVETVAPGEALLTFGNQKIPGADWAVAIENLSPEGDLIKAASRLFRCLRALDRPDVTAIAVAPIPATGLGEAMIDRLTRAAAPR